jgi:nitrogen fixation protein NifZ
MSNSVTIEQLQPGDMIFAAAAIFNDGSVPDLEESALIAEPGCRGVLVNSGFVEESPDIAVYLVRFEDSAGNLGPAVGCFAEELTPLSGTETA